MTHFGLNVSPEEILRNDKPVHRVETGNLGQGDSQVGFSFKVRSNAHVDDIGGKRRQEAFQVFRSVVF